MQKILPLKPKTKRNMNTKFFRLFGLLSILSVTALAQDAPQPPTPPKNVQQGVAIDPTGKRFMKPRERTRYGGPVHTTLTLEKNDTTMNITFIEIQIDPAQKDGYDISVRGTKTPKLTGCDNCAVAGRIILDPKVSSAFENISTDAATQAKQAKNPAANRMISFKNAEEKVFTVATTNEGGFMLTTLPNGLYSIWFGGKRVVNNFLLTSVAAKEEPVKEAK